MKREIKFRAWDEKLKMMTTPFIDFLIFEESENFKKGQVLRQHFEDDDFVPTEIMQYTGLKDKNGQEVYEGDIVRIEYFKTTVSANMGVSEAEAELIGVIEIDVLALVLKNIIGEKWCEYTGYEQGEGECKAFHLHDVYEGSSDAEWRIEVIGNVHENPELIKQEAEQ